MENMCIIKIADEKRRTRTLIQGSVKSTLEKHFQMEQRPSLETIAKLAACLRIKKKIVRIWFCNRRYRERYMKPLTPSNTTAVSPIPAEIVDPLDSANLSPVQSTAELSPSVQDSLRPSVQDSLRPSVQDSTVSSGTPNKRAVLEGSPKDALEKHFAMEPKPSLATIAWLADSLRMKAEVVRTWFGNRRCKEKRMKKFTTLMTPMRQTRLSASRVLRSGDIADESVNGNNSADLSGIGVDPLERPSLDNVENEISLVEDQTSGQATAETNSISEETNNELPEMEYSVESPEQEDSTVPSDVRFTSCQPRQFKTSRKRTLIEGSLKDALEKHFDQDPKPSLKAIVSLARSLRLKAKVVRVWFANRRHKQKYLNPIAKSNRPGNRAASQQAPVPCPIADETADTALNDHDGSFTGSNSSTVEQITDSDQNDESIPASKPETAMPEIISRSSNSTAPSETAAIKRTSGGSFKNGRPWGPLSRRQPVVEDQTEQDEIEITETLLDESTRKLCFAERLIKRCKKIGNQNEMDVYAIPLIRSAESDSTFERFSFGLADELAEHRTVLVLGAEGSNRSKFINGIVNFIFGVEQDDSFRFQLIDEEETNGVKVYDIHHTFSFRVSYSITIVAAPSYDTVTNDSQYFRDQNVAKMLLGAMEKDGGIQQLDMICNVVTEAVVDQSFMSIFGKDMAGSIYNWQPFNHLGDTCSWLEVIQRFCTALADNTNPKSLSLTKQVLQERKQMEAVTDGLESLVKISHGKMKEVDKAKQMIVFCDSQIQSTDEEEDECFVVEMKKKVELPAGEWVYNCNRCYVTCHDAFFKEEPVEDGHLNSEDLYESTVTGYCSVCPDQCNLIMHSNQPYRWVSVEKVTKVSPDLGKIQRNEAEIKWKDIKSKGRDLIKVLEKDLAANGKVVLEHFTATWRCIQRLNRIALRGNSFLTRKVFDVLYDAEQLIKELGFQDGLASLKN